MTKRLPKTPNVQSQDPGYAIRGTAAELRAVEVIEICADTLPPFGFTEAGDTEQEAPEGAPVQLRVTFWLNPFVPAILSPIVVDCPAVMDTAEPAGSVREKSATGGGGATPKVACR
jgi:hypothetical protein